MKKQLQLSALMLVFIMLITAKSNAQTITIDGIFSDWDAIPYLHNNTGGDGTPITAIKAISGATHIYFYLEGTEALPFSAFDLYVNTDDNPATGFLSPGYPPGSGAELLIQGNTFSGIGGISSYNGINGAWGWVWPAVGYDNSGINFSALVTLTGKKAIEFSVNKSILGTIASHISFALIGRIQDLWDPEGSIPALDRGQSYLRISTADVLPVQLVDFTAKIDGNATKLDWKTASEQNNKNFIISRSGDDKVFSKIGEVSGKGTTLTASTYTFYDKQPLNGNNYYKLTQTDFDGKATKIGEQALNFSFSATKVNIAPNPTQGKINIHFAGGKYTSLVLSSIEGKVLQKINLKSNENRYELDLAANPSGIYFVKLTGNDDSIVQKIVKQ